MRLLLPFLILIVLFAMGLLRSRDPHDFEAPGLRWLAAEIGPPPIDFPVALEHLRTTLISTRFSLLTCHRVLDEASDTALDPRWLEVKAKFTDAELGALIVKAFETESRLRLRLQEFGADFPKDTECVESVRRFLSRLTAVSEILGERRAGLPEADDEGRPLALQGAVPYLVLNPAFPKAELKAGDLLVSRGTSFLPAVAERLYGHDAGFTHVDIVAADERGQLSLLGEHLGVGAQAVTLKEAWSAPKVRVLLLRPHDETLARSVSAELFKALHNGSAAPASLSFDFEWIRGAFLSASGGRFKLPLIAAHGKANREVLEQLGLKKTSSVAPGDLEFDPRFEEVATWRDLGLTSQTRMRDAVIGAMLEWIDRERYAFRSVANGGIKALLGEHLPSWPIFNNLRQDQERLPNLDERESTALREFDETGEVLFSHLEEICDEFKDTADRWPTPMEMRDELEKYRKTDLKVYQEYQKTHGYDPLARRPDFHLLFRP